ncbi:MAG: hypothetical protein ACLPKW_14565 [Acetobacteraceae bacterium]
MHSYAQHADQDGLRQRIIELNGQQKMDGEIADILNYSATVRMCGRIASSRSVPERAGRCLIRMLTALQCFVKRRAVGMRDCGGW